jgi:hypothetical protein
MIGRMPAGWAHSSLRHSHPNEMQQVANGKLHGYITNYAIGVNLVPFTLGWDIFVGSPASPVWTLIYGVATMVSAVFFVCPSMGLGLFGWRSPESIRAPLSSMANHLFFGQGMAAAVALA